MSHQLNIGKDSLPSADQDKQSDQRHLRPDSWGSAASSSPVHRENSSRSFVHEKEIVHPEARKFWRESFVGQSIVDVRLFSRAIKHEFEFTQEEEDAVDLIIREIDADSNGTVTLAEFNVFTKKLGLEGACRKVLSKHVKPNQVPNKTGPYQTARNETEAEEEEMLRAKALQEAEDARFARALQAKDAAAAGYEGIKREFAGYQKGICDVCRMPVLADQARCKNQMGAYVHAQCTAGSGDAAAAAERKRKEEERSAKHEDPDQTVGYQTETREAQVPKTVLVTQTIYETQTYQTQKPVYETKYRTVRVPKPIEYEEMEIPYREVRQEVGQEPVYETKYHTLKVPKPIEYEEKEIPYQEVRYEVETHTVQVPRQIMVPQIPTSASAKVTNDAALYEVVLLRATGQFVGPDGVCLS